MQTPSFWAYIGNTAETSPRGIFVSRFDPAAGTLSPPRFAIPADRPNFLAPHPNGRFLYACTATNLAGYEGAIDAFAIDPATGNLTALNQQPSDGKNPAHLAVHPSGKFLAVANYDGATVALLPINSNGHLGSCTSLTKHQGSSINPDRQTKPYPHGVTFDHAGQHLFVPDLGADKIVTYDIDPQAVILNITRTAPQLSPGSGPRHIALSRDDRFAYVINELTSTITVFASNNGTLNEIQTVAPWTGKNIEHTGAEIEIHPSGRWLYASDRGYDSLALCAIDPASGKISLRSHHATGGQTPRHFAIAPGGDFLLAENLRSDSIIVFRIDPQAGELTRTGVPITAPSPLCVVLPPHPPN